MQPTLSHSRYTIEHMLVFVNGEMSGVEVGEGEGGSIDERRRGRERQGDASSRRCYSHIASTASKWAATKWEDKAISEPPESLPQRQQASVTRRQFGEQAKAYASSPLHSRDESLDIMEGMAREHLGIAPAHRNVMDVGCGAGFTAAAMSALADRVLATDLTPEMVEQARRVGHERDAAGMSVAIAAASSLPVRSGSVDLLTCRYAFHHMVDAEQVLGEFHRVLTDEGCFLLADTVATEDPDVYQWMDRVERLRTQATI